MYLFEMIFMHCNIILKQIERIFKKNNSFAKWKLKDRDKLQEPNDIEDLVEITI